MGFRVTEEYDDPNVAGNAIIVLKKENVQIRFVRDRADYYCDLGTVLPPQRWYALYDVIVWLIRKGTPFEAYKPINGLHPVSRLLKKHGEVILVAFLNNHEAIESALRPTEGGVDASS